MTEKKVRVHRGEGAKKAARRKFRHALQNTQYLRLLNEEHLTPASARFHARVAADIIIAQGSTDTNVHGRGLLRK